MQVYIYDNIDNKQHKKITADCVAQSETRLLRQATITINKKIC